MPYELKDSTETLHRRASLFRLAHRRWIHTLLFVYNYTDNPELLDNRDIHTCRREGILFSISGKEHFKARQDPLNKAMNLVICLIDCMDHLHFNNFIHPISLFHKDIYPWN